MYILLCSCIRIYLTRLAQSVERQPFKLVVVGSSPTWGGIPFFFDGMYIVLWTTMRQMI